MDEGYYTEFLFDEIKTLMEAITENDHVAMLNHTSLILQSIPDDTKKRLPQTKKLLEKINRTLHHEGNMRILRLMQRIKKEVDTAIEYFDEDIGSDHRLFYKEELEDEMIMYENEIRKIIADIIKDQTENTINI
jgi:hypothetical protein